MGGKREEEGRTKRCGREEVHVAAEHEIDMIRNREMEVADGKVRKM